MTNICICYYNVPCHLLQDNEVTANAIRQVVPQSVFNNTPQTVAEWTLHYFLSTRPKILYQRREYKLALLESIEISSYTFNLWANKSGVFRSPFNAVSADRYTAWLDNDFG
jgi:hypothetical protein